MPTPEQLTGLKRFYEDWRTAVQRLELAAQTLEGAQTDAKLKEARFKGAAEFAYGSTDISFEYDPAKGTLTFTQPNRETRRKRAKGRR